MKLYLFNNKNKNFTGGSVLKSCCQEGLALTATANNNDSSSKRGNTTVRNAAPETSAQHFLRAENFVLLQAHQDKTNQEVMELSLKL